MPATIVTAPADEPKLIINQSKLPLTGNAPAKTPASVKVPVGKVNETAVADVTVMIFVRI